MLEWTLPSDSSPMRWSVPPLPAQASVIFCHASDVQVEPDVMALSTRFAP